MSPGNPSLLLVDDDLDVCANMADILADLGGYHVDVAHDGPSALHLVRQRPYDVALLDLKMPGMDGLTLYRELKQLRSGTVAILVTAYASELATDEAATSGSGKSSRSRSTSRDCWGWWTKPWASRWSWSWTTTVTCAQPSGTCSASAATGSAWPTA